MTIKYLIILTLSLFTASSQSDSSEKETLSKKEAFSKEPVVKRNYFIKLW